MLAPEVRTFMERGLGEVTKENGRAKPSHVAAMLCRSGAIANGDKSTLPVVTSILHARYV